MDIKSARKEINKRLILYSICDTGSLITGIFSTIFLSVPIYIAANELISNNLNNTNDYYDLIMYCISLGASTIFGNSIYKVVKPEKEIEIDLLKEIKTELKEGKNRFENINDNEFEIAISKELLKQKILKN